MKKKYGRRVGVTKRGRDRKGRKGVKEKRERKEGSRNESCTGTWKNTEEGYRG